MEFHRPEHPGEDRPRRDDPATCDHRAGAHVQAAGHHIRPNERMVWQDGTSLFRGVRQYTLTSRDDGATEVTMVETISGLMLPMIAGSLPDQGPSFERFLANLKAEAERGS
jgi:hypothetical protein